MLATTARPTFSPINIGIGTYDGTVAGFSLTEDETPALSLATRFATITHASAVRSCALRGSTFVTGAADEVIRIYDVARRVEVGTLLHHDGTVNSLQFANDNGRNLLFSAADDSAIAIWRVADWHLLKRLPGHQAPVLDIAVHPSAKVALSVSKDRALFMWNLARGKISFSAKTKGSPATTVQWSPNGSKYLLGVGNNVKISNVDGHSTNTFSHHKKVTCATFLNDDTVATAGDERVVRVWDARSKDVCSAAYNHDARVCGLQFVDGLLVSADVAGGLKIWDQRKAGEPRIETSVSANARITCLTAAREVWHPASVSEPHTDDEDTANAEEKTESKEKAQGKLTKATQLSKENGKQPRPEGTASQRKRKKRKLLS